MKLYKRRSFTIVEILIAITLFVVLIISFLTALWTSFDYLRRVMELRTATLVLQEQVSIIRNLKFSEILSLGGTFSSTGMSTLDNPTGAIIKSYYDGQDEILKITFKLDWTTFNGKPAAKAIVTLMTDNGINKK